MPTLAPTVHVGPIRTLVSAIVALLALGGFSTIGAGSIRAQDATPPASGGTSMVKVIHGSLDTPAVDVYVDGQLAIEALAPGTFTGFVSLPAGSHQIQVTASGTPAAEAVIDATVELVAGAAYEIAALGSLADIQAGVFEVDLSATGADQGRVRVIHGSPDAGPVDVAVTGGDVLVAGAAFPNASEYLTVPAAAYDLEVRAAGTTSVALPLPGTAIDANMIYSVYAIGTVADGTLTALVTAEPATVSCGEALGIGSATDACVRVVHGSPDAGPVDIYVDGAVAIPALAFGTAADFVALPAGEHQIQVVPAGGAPTTAVIDATLPFEAGMAVDIAALGPAAEIQAGVFPVDLSPVGDGMIRAVLVHGSSDAGPVDVAVTGGDVIFANAMYPMASEPVETAAGTLDLEVRPAGGTDVVLPLPGVTFEAGNVYHIYAIGSAADGTLTVLPLAAPAGGSAAAATPAA